MSRPDRPEPGNLISIGPFSRLSSLSVRQLRSYDRAGLLPPAQVDVLSRHRYYDRAQAATAELIALLRSIDVPLSEIQRLLRDDEATRRRRLAAHRRVLVDRVARAQSMLTTLDSMLKEEPMTEEERCSFCDRPAGEVRHLRAGEGSVRICDGCLDLCEDVLAEESSQDGPHVTAAIERLGRSARYALVRALSEAEAAGAAEIGAEHLLAALATGAGGTAGILEELGVSNEELRRRILDRAEQQQGTARPASDPVCSFCGRPAAEVRKLIAGPGAYICDRCVGAEREAPTGTARA